MAFLYHLRIVLLLLVVSVLGFVFIQQNKHVLMKVGPTTTSTTTARLLTTPGPVDVMNLSEARMGFENLIDSIPDYRTSVECASIIELKSKRMKEAELWNFDENMFWKTFGEQPNVCQAIKKTFAFLDKPLSQEEYEFPLVFSMLVHNNPVQILFLLSALYQPQNQFCLSIDAGASEEFQKQMFMLQDCFPNIFVMVTTKVRWCDFAVLRGVYGCIQYLAKMEAKWEYYQYLSGVDLPLKTNLEMVRIFKELNGSFNSGIYDLETYRYKPGAMPPLTLWKSSLSATFSRESANFMVSHPKVQELYNYLKQTSCPDESFWTSIAGNPTEIPMPGGFNASQWRDKLTGDWFKERPENQSKSIDYNYGLYVPEKYYIARYQIWYEKTSKYRCHGRYTSGSCVFGVADLPMLAIRPELIAHKMYFTVQPGAYFCLYEHVRQRALSGETNFSVEAYGELPGPQLLRGVPFEKVDIKSPNGYQYF